MLGTSSLEVFGRLGQYQQVIEALANDRDLLIVGVPGSGRRTLVKKAAEEIGAMVLQVDCIRATDSQRFLGLLCDAIGYMDLRKELIEDWYAPEVSELLSLEANRLKPLTLNESEQWLALKYLLQLPQLMAKAYSRQMVIILEGFPHIRSWDKGGQWETYLRKEINIQKEVSYVLIATIGEINNETAAANPGLEIIELTPIADEFVAAWVKDSLGRQGLSFDLLSGALEMYLDAVQGHLGDASALMRRLSRLPKPGTIETRDVYHAISDLLQEFSTVFETLLLLLPANQVHLLECLAIDPTNRPQSKEYADKHHLSRGGSLQGALSGLQSKGLIYGSEYHYRIALPLLALWLKRRLS